MFFVTFLFYRVKFPNCPNETTNNNYIPDGRGLTPSVNSHRIKASGTVGYTHTVWVGPNYEHANIPDRKSDEVPAQPCNESIQEWWKTRNLAALSLRDQSQANIKNGGVSPVQT